MSLCPYAYLELSLSGSLTASDQGYLTTTGEFLNISALDPLLPTFLIATLCLCALSVITYYSLAIAWEVFWASRRSPSPLDPSAEVVLTSTTLSNLPSTSNYYGFNTSVHSTVELQSSHMFLPAPHHVNFQTTEHFLPITQCSQPSPHQWAHHQ